MALSYPVAAVIERLAGAPSLKLVGLAPDLSAALKSPPRTAPAVFVATSMRGQPINWTGPLVQQERELTLHLVVWIRNAGEAKAVASEMQAVEADINARMAGWSPGDAFSAPRFAEARDEFSEAAYYVRQLAFVSRWTFSAQVQP